MLVNLQKALLNPLVVVGGSLLLVGLLFSDQAGYLYYLTVAQLVFVPAFVQLVITLSKLDKVLLIVGMVAVTVLLFDPGATVSLICTLLYLLGTLRIAWKGIDRFLKRGFTNTAELMIDAGLIYLAIGGMWFLAYIAGFDTGFSAITNWLTAIHFHYSAFLLSISVGLLGRIQMTKLYKISALVIATGPMTVAIGITFSHIIEIISVSLYVAAIYALTYYTFRLKFPPLQALFVRLPFLTLCITILGSFLYAYGNVTGTTIVTIPDMLAFHGLLNCLVFGSFTILGWALHVPQSKQKPFDFPVSRIRGKLKEVGETHPGLVDQLGEYTDIQKLPTKIIRFYERTEEFQLRASVKWATWFKPLAFLYQFVSRKMGQLNLPFSSSPLEMTGEIRLVNEQLDGRTKPRVWKRTIGSETVFVAIYSKHQSDGVTYMNIALPLPFSSMHGILQLSTRNEKLYLTSHGEGDAGTYLAIGTYVFRLPLHENFVLCEQGGILIATHDMTLFGLHFLQIDYLITEKTNNKRSTVL